MEPTTSQAVVAALSPLLVANRGEVAVRVLRTAAELGCSTLVTVSEDERRAAWTRHADDVVVLPGPGPSAHLDVDAVVAAAVAAGARGVHPGWGFLSEDPRLASALADAGLRFVGPSPATLARVGDKVAARRSAADAGVPVLEGTDGPVDADGAAAFAATLPPGTPLVVKAVSGGGGRGIRVVDELAELPAAVAACAAEARTATGAGAVYVERRLVRARHVEVQLAADAGGDVVALGDRDCSLQRRHQKLLELAPAPMLDAALRARLHRDAVAIGRATELTGLATVEFLVDVDTGEHRFLEVNPRLQVEHTVTEAVTGRDLVAAQLALAAGTDLRTLELDDAPAVRGVAVQARVAAVTTRADGEVAPTTGTVRRFAPPTGAGIRVDTALHDGDEVTGRYDPLLAKVIAHRADLPTALRALDRALGELVVDGVATDLPLLRTLLGRDDLLAGQPTTGTVADLLAEDGAAWSEPATTPGTAARGDVLASLLGTVVAIPASPGDTVSPDTPVVVVEAMKMHHVLTASTAGTLREVTVDIGDEVVAGQRVARIEVGAIPGVTAASAEADLDHVRPELARWRERRALLHDDARAEAVADRHAKGRRTARENLDDLCDPGSFVEYGGFAVAAQRQRRSVEDLQRRTPADGFVGGLARVNGERVGPDRARTVVASYDYLVLAGTQGVGGHRKKDRLFELTERWRVPVVLFAEGGGGRPGDTDQAMVAGLDTVAFALWAGLSGVVPRIAVASGYCFAGNAALFGASDVTIATRDASIGMGGPAMIEGGGLGTVAPQDVGPAAMHDRNGVVDVLVDDDAAAVAAAKRVLGYFQGPVTDVEVPDRRRLRHVVPEDRKRAYDVHQAIDALFDVGSVTELRPRFAAGMVTALARLEGRPVGVVANDPRHLAGAITSDGADKAARFLQLCEAFDLPVVSLCDTPGIMVGPDAEATGLVRHAARLFLAGAALTVPTACVVLRKGYGLGAQAMAFGSFRAPLLTVSWPTGEFGGMGLEGAVSLGLRKELAAIADPDERRRVFEQAVAFAYAHGEALSMASHLEIDDVIDPFDTRHVLHEVLAAAPPRDAPGRRFVDAW